jgi:hypothetical protein
MNVVESIPSIDRKLPVRILLTNLIGTANDNLDRTNTRKKPLEVKDNLSIHKMLIACTS